MAENIGFNFTKGQRMALEMLEMFAQCLLVEENSENGIDRYLKWLNNLPPMTKAKVSIFFFDRRTLQQMVPFLLEFSNQADIKNEIEIPRALAAMASFTIFCQMKEPRR